MFKNIKETVLHDTKNWWNINYLMWKKIFSNSIKKWSPWVTYFWIIPRIWEKSQTEKKFMIFLWMQIYKVAQGEGNEGRCCLRSYLKNWNFLTRWKIDYISLSLGWSEVAYDVSYKSVFKNILTNYKKSHHVSDALGLIYSSMHPVLHKIAIHLSIQKTRRIYNEK